MVTFSRYSEEAKSQQQPPRIMLLCGGDLVDSFTRTDETNPNGGRLWQKDHLMEILAQFGLIVVDRVGANAQHTLQSKQLDFLHGLLDNVAIINDDTYAPVEREENGIWRKFRTFPAQIPQRNEQHTAEG